MDRIYALPFTRRAHPSYDAYGGVPALEEVAFSITSTRGCYGGCSFCAISSHQGSIVSSRSAASVLAEAKLLTADPDFKGYIHDVGGPTANFRGPACRKQALRGPCSERQCLFPVPCSALEDTHGEYLDLLRSVRRLPGIKKVFIRSGIRYDYLLGTCSPELAREFTAELARYHVSGQLKVAPEHISPAVLDIMGKPAASLFDRFSELFFAESRKAGMKQYIIPYFISGHPGSTLNDAVALAEYLHARGFIPDQVQDFYPTPGTVSTCIYFTGLDPRPGRGFAPVHVPKGREKNLQRALIHFHKPENRPLVLEALSKAGRTDLIGEGASCLVSGKGRRGPSTRSRLTGGRSSYTTKG
jgi:uncharacterized radical SAM protein YgiQ